LKPTVSAGKQIDLTNGTNAESIEKLQAETLSILAERYGSRKLRLLNKVIARFKRGEFTS